MQYQQTRLYNLLKVCVVCILFGLLDTVCPVFLLLYLHLHLFSITPFLFFFKILLYIADFLDEDFAFDRETPSGQNQRGWQKSCIGQPNQRKASNFDVSLKNRPQQGGEAEGTHFSFCDTDKNASLKG